VSTRSKADELRKQNKFDEAVGIYSTMWPDGDKWTGWGYAHSLRKLRRSREALTVAEETHRIAPDFALGRSVLTWAAFDVIRSAEELTPNELGLARRVVRLLEGEGTNHEKTSPFVPTVLRVARHLVRKHRYLQALAWLKKLDAARLGTDEFQFQDERGKQRRLASHRERYFSLRTVCFEKLERWEECLDAAESAVAACGQLHHDNDIWLARRIARSKVNLGRVEEGLKELELLAKKKAASFIFTDIAVAAHKLGQADRAESACLDALSAQGDLGFKLEALLLLARVLWSKGQQERACKHLALYIAVRKTNAWSVDKDAQVLAEQWNVASDVDVAAALSELKPTWRRSPPSGGSRKSGIVDSILPHGKAGFIVTADKQRFYFETRDLGNGWGKPSRGSRVNFATRPSFDRKHNRESVVAYDIRKDH
jgi:tetratricopeptide (TPR) repeat protein